MSADDELTERAAWVLRRCKALNKMAKQMLLLGPAAGAGRVGELRDHAGEMIDVARQLAEDPRVSAEFRRRFRRAAEWMNKSYAELNAIYAELQATEQPEGDDDD
jgi:hypothetical protein